jgi:hypothetical protein
VEGTPGKDFKLFLPQQVQGFYTFTRQYPGIFASQGGELYLNRGLKLLPVACCLLPVASPHHNTYSADPIELTFTPGKQS